MSTDTPIPVLLVALSDDESPWTLEHIKQCVSKQLLPVVVLAPAPPAPTEPTDTDPETETVNPDPTLETLLEDIAPYSIIRNTGGKNPVLFRANALDILQSHSNLNPVAVMEFDDRCMNMWDLPRMER